MRPVEANAKRVVAALEYRYTTGFLWWKQWHSETYYLEHGVWYNAANNQTADDKMQQKLKEMYLRLDCFRIDQEV